MNEKRGSDAHQCSALTSAELGGKGGKRIKEEEGSSRKESYGRKSAALEEEFLKMKEEKQYCQELKEKAGGLEKDRERKKGKERKGDVRGEKNVMEVRKRRKEMGNGAKKEARKRGRRKV